MRPVSLASLLALTAVATASRPRIVFVPGSWHTPNTFDHLRDLLHGRDWTTSAVGLASNGVANKTLGDDADAVRSTVAPLVEQGEQVVIVAHSYGGMAGAQGVRDLGYIQREAQGMDGGVIMFVYMSAMVTPAGNTLKDNLGGEWPDYIRFEGDYVWPVDPAQLMYSDLDPIAQQTAVDALVGQAFTASLDPVTYEPWHDMATMFLFCDGDQLLPPAVQEQLAALLGADAASFHSQGAHDAYLSFPEEIVEGVEYAVQVGLESL